MTFEAYQRPEDGLRDYRAPVAVDAPPPAIPPAIAVALLAFFVGLALGVALTAADPCVRMTVRPLLMLPMTRGDIRVELRIARHADHRSYALSWTSEEGSTGASYRPLEGADAEVLHTHWLKSQPAAHYFFGVAVFDSRGKATGRDRGEVHTASGPPLGLFIGLGEVAVRLTLTFDVSWDQALSHQRRTQQRVMVEATDVRQALDGAEHEIRRRLFADYDPLTALHYEKSVRVVFTNVETGSRDAPPLLRPGWVRTFLRIQHASDGLAAVGMIAVDCRAGLEETDVRALIEDLELTFENVMQAPA